MADETLKSIRLALVAERANVADDIKELQAQADVLIARRDSLDAEIAALTAYISRP